MKKYTCNITLLACLILLITTGCSSSKMPVGESILSKRYKSIQPALEKKDKDAVIDVSLEALVKSSNVLQSTYSVFGLKGQGQKALIEQYKALAKDDASKFNSFINTKFLEPEKSNITDLSTRDFTLQFSVTEKEFFKHLATGLAPGDRIEHLKITVTLDDASKKLARFSNWNQFTTQYGMFTISDLSFTGTKELIVNPSIPLTAGSVTLGSYTNTKTGTESDSLRRQYIAFNGTLHDDSFVIEQTGTPEKNLGGNFAIDLSIEFQNADGYELFNFENLLDDKGNRNPAAKVNITTAYINFPQLPANTIGIKMKCEYEVRHILKGDVSYPEGDDDIIYYYGSFLRDIPAIIKLKDVKPTTWRILLGVEEIKVKRLIDNTAQELVFSSYHDAVAFNEWLKYQLPALKENLKIGEFYFLTEDAAAAIKNMNNTTNTHQLKVALNP